MYYIKTCKYQMSYSLSLRNVPLKKKYWNEIFSHCVPPPPPKEEGRDLLMGMYTYYVFCGWPLQTLSGWRRKGLHTGLHMQEPTWGFWETTLGQWSGEKILMLIQPYATRPFNHNRSVPNLSKKNVCQWHFAEHTTCNKVIVVWGPLQWLKSLLSCSGSDPYCIARLTMLSRT